MIKKPSLVWTGLLFFIFTCKIFASQLVIRNDNIVGERAIQKIEAMGNELFNKTGVSIYLSAVETLGETNIITYEKDIVKVLQSPYILLTLVVKEQKVDIFFSKDLKEKFDKDSVLSPYPWKGTIIPLLSVKKNEDKYSAAMLNGYADIVEQVANSYDVSLDSAIGSTNKSLLGYMRALFYLTITLVFGVYMYKKIRRKDAAK